MIERVPSLAATSRGVTFKSVYQDQSKRPSFELSPRMSPSCCQPFTTLALMGKFHNTTVAEANFMVISRQGRIEQIEVDKTPADDETPIFLGKRKFLKDPREGPVAKTRRSFSANEEASAIRANHPTLYSASKPMGESNSKGDFLSCSVCDICSGDYSLGFHHVISMLIIGKSCCIRISFAAHQLE